MKILLALLIAVYAFATDVINSYITRESDNFYSFFAPNGNIMYFKTDFCYSYGGYATIIIEPPYNHKAIFKDDRNKCKISKFFTEIKP